MALMQLCEGSRVAAARKPTATPVSRARRNICRHVFPRLACVAQLQTSRLLGASKKNRRSLFTPYPPFFDKKTTLRQISESIWLLQQDFATNGIDVHLNCFVLKLSDGSLLIQSPPAPTDECLELLSQVPGVVKHILVPSTSPEHWYNAPGLAAYCPEAVVWTCPGLLDTPVPVPVASVNPRAAFESIKQTHTVVSMDKAPEGAWEGELLLLPFKGPFSALCDVTLFFRRERALVLTDLAFAISEPSGLAKFAVQAARIDNRLGAPFAYLFFTYDRKQGRAWYNTTKSWQWDRLLCSHGQPIVGNGRAQFENAFGFAERL